MERLIRGWNGEYVVTRFDRETETMIFVAVHRTTLGVATGGTRLRTYPHPREALRDAMRLAEGMTNKFAVIDFPRGGGKAVLAVPGKLSPVQREGLMLRLGKWLADLNGIFETGPDLGTTSADMRLVARHFSGVFGLPAEAGGAGDPGPETALGVFCGIEAACEHHFGTSDLDGRSVLVQGAGSVGESLIRMLRDAGCKVKFSETDPVRIDEIRRQLGLPFVQPEAVYREPCDVFSPCATGGILNRETIPRLVCPIIAGAANNQLDRPEHGEALHKRGILYAPDYVVNAGGAIFLPSVERWGWTVERARERIRQIGDTLREIFERSKEQRISPAHAAAQLARDRLERAALLRSEELGKEG